MISRVIHFPADAYCGKLYLRDAQNPEEESETVDARGDVIIPEGKPVWLWVDNDEAIASLPLLARLPAENFVALESVCFGCTNANDGDLRHLVHLSHLKGLALWETYIGDEGLRLLKNFSQLEWLDLGDTKITDNGLQQLRSLTALHELSLPNTAVGNLGIESLAALKNLKTLDLMNTKVNDDGVACLSFFAELRYLRIYETGITEEGYSELKQNLPACKIRYFESNDL